MNLLEGRFDLVLHLLDRQVVADDGRLVCKVDDIELVQHEDGTLEVSGLLAGMPALVPRLAQGSGRRLADGWSHLVVGRADGNVPYRIDLSLVSRLDSAVALEVGQQDVMRRQLQEASAAGTTRRRLNELLGAEVWCEGESVGRVTDVRAAPQGAAGRVQVTDLLVGRNRPGSLLGYDRKTQGPAAVRWIVRWLHRHGGRVPLHEADVDWDARRVTLRRRPERLSSALEPNG